MVRFLVFLLFLTPVQVAANGICDDLWVSRNTLFDNAGQCFQTPLGRSIFDNSDCTTDRAVLNPEDIKIVSLIETQEEEFNCQTNTRRRTLDVALLRDRLALKDVPIAREEQARCGGYKGSDIPLRAGADESTQRLDTIEAGLSVNFAHLSPYPGWDFVTVMDPLLRPIGLGWIETRSDWFSNCDELIG